MQQTSWLDHMLKSHRRVQTGLRSFVRKHASTSTNTDSIPSETSSQSPLKSSEATHFSPHHLFTSEIPDGNIPIKGSTCLHFLLRKHAPSLVLNQSSSGKGFIGNADKKIMHLPSQWVSTHPLLDLDIADRYYLMFTFASFM
jgi:hypothetical protein